VLLWWIGAALAGSLDIEAVMVDELARAMEVLAEEEHPPHYVAVTVHDTVRIDLAARDGALWSKNTRQGRALDVDLRVGSPDLDSSHRLRGLSSFAGDLKEAVRIAYDGPGEEASLRHALWQSLDASYRNDRQLFQLLEADRTVRIEEENPAPDFEPRAPLVFHTPPAPLEIDADRWGPLLREVSLVLDGSDEVFVSTARVVGVWEQHTMVDTEGARIVHGRTHARLGMEATAVADDGERVTLFRAVDVHDPADFPAADHVLKEAHQLVRDLEALRVAPRVGSYTGPVILSGRATAVFFHEVMGHRVEGHRQKRDDEGKTFLEHIGDLVLPEWIDVVDDPTVATLHGVDLNGHYLVDDEGVQAQPAQLVTDGRFEGFLMSRSPLENVPHSNGHGRRSPGNRALARMGNTLVTATQTVSGAELEARLVKELKRQDQPYGYVVDEIDGGFTMTGRVMPNAFNVRASVTRRVFADGRPSELVRGIDLVGTPLVAFQSILAASDTPEVFNGTCGAESGWVPVSAVAPALLFSRLEFQLKEKSSQRPPLVDKDPTDATTALEVSP
jgi:TldD protein